jgi:hypothetical protein
MQPTHQKLIRCLTLTVGCLTSTAKQRPKLHCCLEALLPKPAFRNTYWMTKEKTISPLEESRALATHCGSTADVRNTVTKPLRPGGLFCWALEGLQGQRAFGGGQIRAQGQRRDRQDIVCLDGSLGFILSTMGKHQGTFQIGLKMILLQNTLTHKKWSCIWPIPRQMMLLHHYRLR